MRAATVKHVADEKNEKISIHAAHAGSDTNSYVKPE